jgi:hypothetical protein
MRIDIEYTPAERRLLWALAALGFVGVNGAFLYSLTRPEVLEEALTNPLGLAFVAEALLLMGVLAYLLARWGVSRVSWVWFVLLSLLGSMAFALPVALLWRGRRASP